MNEAEVRQEDVRRALRQLARDFSAGRSRLIRLDCVHRSVRSAGFGISEEACSYALGCLFQEIAAEELQRLRSAAGILGPTDAATPGRIPSDETIRRDFGRSDPLLESWSAIYHLFLRPELGLDLAGLERLLGDRHRRTLQRRVARGVQALTDRLWQRERAARAQRRRRALRAALPPASGRPAPSIRGSVGALYARLFEAEDLAGLVIHGPAGIGKTTLARAVAEQAVGSESIHGLTWLSGAAETGPSTNSGVPAMLAETIEAALGRMAEDERALLVIDDVDRPDLLAALQRRLSRAPLGARFVLVGRASPSLAQAWYRWRCRPLSGAQALVLLRQEARHLGMQDLARAADEDFDALVSACAGLPKALLRAARALRFDGPEAVARSMSAAGPGRLGASLGRELWGGTWPATTPETRGLVRAVTAIEREGREPTLGEISLRLGRTSERTADALVRALDAGLLLPRGDVSRRVFMSAPFLGQFIASRCGQARPEAPEARPAETDGPRGNAGLVETDAGPEPRGPVPSPRHGQANGGSESGVRRLPAPRSPALSSPAD